MDSWSTLYCLVVWAGVVICETAQETRTLPNELLEKSTLKTDKSVLFEVTREG